MVIDSHKMHFGWCDGDIVVIFLFHAHQLVGLHPGLAKSSNSFLRETSHELAKRKSKKRKHGKHHDSI